MSEYEFNKEENEDFEMLTQRLLLVAITTGLTGITGLIAVIIAFDPYLLVSSLAVIVFAIFFYLPIDNFKRIITTEGSDIKELVRGFFELRAGWNVSIGILSLLAVIAFIKMLINVF
ncbi:MAG: hypothetical protein IH840_16825 [Candidatus Heimdallarchaeota archaeon]|nr:hypothetical protein [Candidatus Heimdallarchaeota archaeon]